jgi:hypothetical protein
MAAEHLIQPYYACAYICLPSLADLRKSGEEKRRQQRRQRGWAAERRGGMKRRHQARKNAPVYSWYVYRVHSMTDSCPLVPFILLLCLL